MKKKSIGRVVLIVTLFGLALPGIWAAGTQDASEGGVIDLEFFQNKPEAVETFNTLLDGFMEEHPQIRATQNQMPDAGTVLMTRLASGEMPDSMSINGNATYGEIAASGSLANWNGTEIAGRVHEAYIDMSQRLVGDMENIYGIPYTSNANTVLYNIDIFNELGLDVPETWPALLQACEAIVAAGKTPFFHTYADSWTVMVPWNSLAANLQGKTFFEDLSAGKTTFSARYRGVAEKLLALSRYGTNDNFAHGYSDGNIAFANGESAMLIQGVWAIGEVKNANPDINIGVFALPVRDKAGETLLVSGVDSIFSIAADSKKQEAAETLIAYLTREDVAGQYIEAQNTFSAIKGVVQSDPIMNGIKTYFERGQITFFPDHYYPPGMQSDNLIQEYIIDGNVEKLLSSLDDEYQKVMERR